MQSACQISAYAHYARTPVLQLKQRTDDFFNILRVGQNHIKTVYIRYFWQGNHQIYSHMQFWPTLDILCRPTQAHSPVNWQIAQASMTWRHASRLARNSSPLSSLNPSGISSWTYVFVLYVCVCMYVCTCVCCVSVCVCVWWMCVYVCMVNVCICVCMCATCMCVIVCACVYVVCVEAFLQVPQCETFNFTYQTVLEFPEVFQHVAYWGWCIRIARSRSTCVGLSRSIAMRLNRGFCVWFSMTVTFSELLDFWNTCVSCTRVCACLLIVCVGVRMCIRASKFVPHQSHVFDHTSLVVEQACASTHRFVWDLDL